MNPNELFSTTGETVEYAKQYIQQQADYIKLETAERVAKTTSNLITMGIIAASVLLVVLFLSIAAGFYLGTLLNSYALAFLIIAILYLFITVLVIYFKREMITNPILSLLIKEILN